MVAIERGSVGASAWVVDGDGTHLTDAADLERLGYAAVWILAVNSTGSTG